MQVFGTKRRKHKTDRLGQKPGEDHSCVILVQNHSISVYSIPSLCSSKHISSLFIETY